MFYAHSLLIRYIFYSGPIKKWQWFNKHNILNVPLRPKKESKGGATSEIPYNCLKHLTRYTMKRTFKKLTCSLVTVVLTVALLTACGGKRLSGTYLSQDGFGQQFTFKGNKVTMSSGSTAQTVAEAPPLPSTSAFFPALLPVTIVDLPIVFLSPL